MEWPQCIKKRKKHSSNSDGEAMSGLGQLDSTGEDVRGTSATSSRPVPTLQQIVLKQMVLKPAYETQIDSADKSQCKDHIQDLKDLLKRAEDRLETIQKEEERRGLSYEGDDKVICKCGNFVKRKGNYYKKCSWRKKKNKCGREMCTKCSKKCITCGLWFCKKCSGKCDMCNSAMCWDCSFHCECGQNVCGRKFTRCEYHQEDGCCDDCFDGPYGYGSPGCNYR